MTTGNPSFAGLRHVGVVVKDIKKAIAFFKPIGIAQESVRQTLEAKNTELTLRRR
jgi:hypothetical protein